MKRFVSEWTDENGNKFGGEIDAIDWHHAEQIASTLNPPQTVIGVLYATVQAEHWTEQDANKFAQAIADMGDEPPDACEFD